MYNNILETIGNTPLVKLNKVTSSLPCTVVAKVETFNPGNSIKDRMALKMIEDAEVSGALKPGGTIIECTSGNTGMGLAIAAIVKGYRCIFTTNDKQSKEKMDALRAFGAEVIICPTAVEPEDPRSYYSVANKLHKEIKNSFFPNQYDNLSNRQAHYESTGPEIWDQTKGKITHLVVGVGTGGTICGSGKYLKEQNADVKIWGIDSYGSVFKKYKETGEFDKKEIYPYITEGIGEDFLPKNVDFDVIDHFEKVTDKDAAIMTRRIVKEEGIWVGNSAGSAIAGLLQMKDKLSKDDLVVVVFHDHGSRYVNKFFNDDWMREHGFISNKTITASDLVNRNGSEVISVSGNDKLLEVYEVMKNKNISQVPVTRNGEVVGCITERIIFQNLLQENARELKVGSVAGKPFPFVELGAHLDEISSKINKENPAVLVKQLDGSIGIITEYDVIDAVAG